jgi:predicted  nucleic acid-binding Zn ribbon protein
VPPDKSTSAGSSLVPIERPLCPNCQTDMALARIMPGLPGFDLRYFECSSCGAVVKMTVAIAPVTSEEMTDWITGDLKRPE